MIIKRVLFVNYVFRQLLHLNNGCLIDDPNCKISLKKINGD